ncbi:MAG TPA: diaminobutyrate acetyltransferase [Cellvibrio sp.]|nr:diaminobutyrate acetyltransferase [Cellvibrio sp.]
MPNIYSLNDNLVLRSPVASDGATLNSLVEKSPPLDSNSLYCNLLQCTHFSGTSVAAIFNKSMVGFISGYRPPETPDTLFIWQVVVAETFRGSGLGKTMLHWLIDQPACTSAVSLSTTITPENKASWALFKSFARERNAESTKSIMFHREKHFAGQHDDEHLLTIAPLHQKTIQQHLDDLKGQLHSRASRPF